jgi:hypothetical protein
MTLGAGSTSIAADLSRVDAQENQLLAWLPEPQLSMTTFLDGDSVFGGQVW